MRHLVIASCLVLASPAFTQEEMVLDHVSGVTADIGMIPASADPVLVAPEQPSPWPLTMRLERPHSDEAPACGALAAIERWAPEHPRERHHRHRRHRR